MAKASEQQHILVVNDTVAILDLFTALLEDEGFQVSTDGFSVELGEMLARIREMQPDLIVLDLVIMEEGKGWQLLQLLRMDRETRDIPVIALTALAMKGDEERIRSAGCDGYIAKPLSYKNFLETISFELEKAETGKA